MEEYNEEEALHEITTKEDLHVSRDSLDWDGTYSGVLPCEECEGIDTYLTIQEDLSYQLEQRFITDEGDAKDTVRTLGQFRWDEDGNTIILRGPQEEELRFSVGETFLTPLDSNNRKVSGVPGNDFRLLKIN